MNEIIHKDISTFKEKTSLDGTEFIQVSKDEKVNLLQVIDNSIAKRLTESDSESTIPGFNFNPRSIYYRTTSNTPIILHSRNIEALRGGVTQSQVDAGEEYRRFEHKWYEDYKLGEIAFSVEDKFELLTDSFSCYFIDIDLSPTTHLLSEVWISGLISNIKLGAFSGCNKIHRFHNIWDPDTVSKDGSQVFNLFKHLGETQVELVHIAPASLSKNIDPSLPMSVASQTLTFVVDDKVTTVADLAFGYMPKDVLLKGVVFGDKVTRVGTTIGAFYENRCVESLVYGSKVDLKEPDKPISGTGVITIWPLSLQSISIKNNLVSGPPTAPGHPIRYIVSKNNLAIYSSRLTNNLQNGDTIESSPLIPETPPTHVVNSVIKYHTTDNTPVQHIFHQGYSPFWNYYGEMAASEVLAYPIEELRPDYIYTLGGVPTVFPLFSGNEVMLGGNYFMGTLGNMGGDFCIPVSNRLILGSNASSYTNSDSRVPKLQTVDRLVFPASLKALTSSAITIHGLERDIHLYFYSTYPPSYLPQSTEISTKILEISNHLGKGTVYIHVLAGLGAKYSKAAGWMASIHTYGNRIQIVEDLYM